MHVYIYPPGVGESPGFIKSPSPLALAGALVRPWTDATVSEVVTSGSGGIPVTRRLHQLADRPPRKRRSRCIMIRPTAPAGALSARSMPSALSDRGAEVGAAAARAHLHGRIPPPWKRSAAVRVRAGVPIPGSIRRLRV